MQPEHAAAGSALCNKSAAKPNQRRKLVQQITHQDSDAPVCRILQRNRLPAGTAGAVSVGRF